MSLKDSERIHSGVTGATGGTGGTGNPTVTTNSAVSTGNYFKSLNDNKQTIEEFAKAAAYEGLVGATGGLGAIPCTVELAKERQISSKDMRETLIAEINSKSDEAVLIGELKILFVELEVIQDKANSILAFHAYRIGLYLLKLQAIRYAQNLNDWTVYAAQYMPFIKKRTREKYMSLASLPLVEDHLWLGIERLAAIGTYYTSLNDGNRKVLGSDPISSLLKKQGFRDEMDFDERKARADAIIEVLKLERMGVTIDPELMENFLAVQDPLTGEERKFLKKLVEDDKAAPAELLTKVITGETKRMDFVLKDTPVVAGDTDDESKTLSTEDSSTDMEPEVAPPNVDALLTKTKESIEPYLHGGMKLVGTVDVEIVDSLIKDLEALKKLLLDKSAS